MTQANDERALLEQNAVLARSRLMRTLDALDHRREDILTVASEVKRAASSTALALATAGATAAMYYMLRHVARREGQVARREGKTRRTYGRTRPRRASLLVQAFETLAVMGLAYGVSQLARKSLAPPVEGAADVNPALARRKRRSALRHRVS